MLILRKRHKDGQGLVDDLFLGHLAHHVLLYLSKRFCFSIKRNRMNYRQIRCGGSSDHWRFILTELFVQFTQFLLCGCVHNVENDGVKAGRTGSRCKPVTLHIVSIPYSRKMENQRMLPPVKRFTSGTKYSSTCCVLSRDAFLFSDSTAYYFFSFSQL